MKILKKVNFSLNETINAGSATKVIKNYAGQTLKVTGFMIAEKEDVEEGTGEIKLTRIGVVKAGGELISSISPTVVNSIDTIINAYQEAGLIEEIANGIQVNIKADKSAKNREFFHLELV